MNNESERFLKTVIQALVDWWFALGNLGWVIAGIIFMVGLIGAIALLRWIARGGLARAHFGSFYRPRNVSPLAHREKLK